MTDVIIGHDGEPRCAWAGAGDTPGCGLPRRGVGTWTYEESALFEALTLGRVRDRAELVDRLRQAGSVPQGVLWIRRGAGSGDDRTGRRPTGTGRFDHPQSRQDPGYGRQRARHGIRITKPGRAGEVVPDRPRARTPVHRRPAQVDPAGGGVRQAVEVSGVPLCRAYQRIRVHAERRRGQRSRPRLLPRERAAGG